MAGLTIDYQSDQYTQVASYHAGGRGDVLIPHTDAGKLRCFHFRYKNETGGTIAADKTIALGYLPQGKILPMSKVICTDLGTGTTLDLGFDEYKKNDETLVASNPDFLVDGADVATAAINSELHTIGTAEVQNDGYTLEGFALLVAQPRVSTWAADGELNVFIFMLTGQ